MARVRVCDVFPAFKNHDLQELPVDFFTNPTMDRQAVLTALLAVMQDQLREKILQDYPETTDEELEEELKGTTDELATDLHTTQFAWALALILRSNNPMLAFKIWNHLEHSDDAGSSNAERAISISIMDNPHQFLLEQTLNPEFPWQSSSGAPLWGSPEFAHIALQHIHQIFN